MYEQLLKMALSEWDHVRMLRLRYLSSDDVTMHQNIEINKIFSLSISIAITGVCIELCNEEVCDFIKITAENPPSEDIVTKKELLSSLLHAISLGQDALGIELVAIEMRGI